MELRRPKFTCDLVILSGRSETEQGGYPWALANRNLGRTCVLNEELDDSETGVDMRVGPNANNDALAFLQPGTVIQIDSEKMLLLSVSGATWTVTRGYASTTPAAHTTGATITVTTTGDGVIATAGVRKGSILFPAAWTAADLCFLGCSTRDGTYLPVRDDRGSLIVIASIATATAESRSVPPAVFDAAPFFRMKSCTAAGGVTTAANQGADRTLRFSGGE